MKPLLALIIVAGATVLTSATVAAEPRIEMQVGTQPGYPIASAQQWNKILGELGVANLSIRTARPGELPEIETDRSGSVIVYRVMGLLTAQNELYLPAGRFKLSDRAALTTWFKRLREEGAEVSTARSRPPFGLEAAQLEEVRDDLRFRVGIGTAGQRPSTLVEELAAELGYPLEVSGDALKALAAAGPITEELKDVARGTALAAIVRPAGLAFWPIRTPGGKIEYRIGKVAGQNDVWPVGWPLVEKREEVAPQLFEFLTVALDDVTLAEALAAIGPRIKMPILLDYDALSRRRIDLTEVRVSLPEKRSTYSLILQSVLTQAMLKWEVRLDEANRPLVWITTLRK